MTLGELLDRACDALGELRATPRWFPRQKLVDYANRGTLLFRSVCKEVWYRVDMPVTIAVGEYTIPPEILELRRVAYDDTTLEARAVNTIQSRDALWQTTNSPNPRAWTSVGFAQNKFWIWPVPGASTEDTFAWDSEYGVTVRDTDAAGIDATMIRDPAGPAIWNPEYGLLVARDTTTQTSDYGEVFYTSTPQGKALTLWGTAHPGTLVSDDQELPIRRPWQMAVLWFVLWQVYEEEGDHHNSIVAAWYRDQFTDLVERCKLRTTSPVPAQVRHLHGNHNTYSSPAQEAVLGDFIDSGGNSVPTLWQAEE